MNRKIALRWARALESGKYPQTRRALRDSTGLCCLGVLCSLHAEAHPEIAREQLDPDTYMGEASELPLDVMEWAGMDSGQGVFLDEKLEIKSGIGSVDYAEDLIDLNDAFDFNFNQIAAVIRKHSDNL